MPDYLRRAGCRIRLDDLRRLGPKFKSNAVDAVPQPRRPRPILKHTTRQNTQKQTAERKVS